jgi:HSP20 family molecular chaperone IbpA
MLPYMMVRNMFDELADSAFSAHSVNGIMRTDIRESQNSYEVAIDLPGVKKENLSAELKDNYLVVTATIGQPEEDSTGDWRYLRRERFVGTLQRSFYVGDGIQQENIHAKFEDGTLFLTIPKQVPVSQVPQKNLIAIEG